MTRYLFLCLLVSYQSLAQTFTSFDGTKIYYETLGQGRPVVLLHGFIVDSNTWKRGKLPDLLAANGFKVILIDLRGNGLSDRPQQLAAYQQDAEIKDVMALMQWLGYSQYDVVGYSRGAILAARELVIDSHVRSAVLGGMGSDFTNPAWARRVMFAEAFGGKAHSATPNPLGLILWCWDICSRCSPLPQLSSWGKSRNPYWLLAVSKIPTTAPQRLWRHLFRRIHW
jgi:pimeloyl-ACP methyl ester carboxylesterase